MYYRRSPLNHCFLRFTRNLPPSRSPPLSAHTQTTSKDSETKVNLPQDDTERERISHRRLYSSFFRANILDDSRPATTAAKEHPRRLGRDRGRRMALQRQRRRRCRRRRPSARRPQEEEEEGQQRPARRDQLGRHLRPDEAHQRRGVPAQR